jgi:pimeloyl-ACP methyl ester carboxylesterase
MLDRMPAHVGGETTVSSTYTHLALPRSTRKETSVSDANPTVPTVVLVHGAFAKLRAAGVATEAVPNPLRSLTGDGEYVASILGQIAGPIVLVGHSYGGPVITYASAKASNVEFEGPCVRGILWPRQG